VAEGDLGVRARPHAQLDAAGYNVHTAKIGTEAVRRIFDPRPDVVILDINMPEFDRAQRSKALHEEPSGRGIE